jgi:hypothetical protein
MAVVVKIIIRPGVGHVEFVKDLLIEKVVTRKFQCSRFGPAYPAGLGWVSIYNLVYYIHDKITAI